MDPADLPRDGRGGYLYTQNIYIPNYANTTTYTTYSAIDDYLLSSSGSATTLGVTFGACLMTLIHVLVFTTPDKRGRIIFNCIVVGLFLEAIRQFCGIWATTRSGTNSSYFLLTLTPDNATESEFQAFSAANAYTNFSLGTKVNSIIDALTSILAFMSIQVCFCVLVQAMMSAMRRKTARIVIISLAILGFHGVVWRIVQFIWNTLEVFRPSTTRPLPDWLYLATSVAYTVSTCAWCLVYGYLVVRSALSRIRLGLEFKRGEARHVMIMTTLESMIIPSRSLPIW
jgi:Fungal pheromone mating factor STE2 GPCR